MYRTLGAALFILHNFHIYVKLCQSRPLKGTVRVSLTAPCIRPAHDLRTAYEAWATAFK